MKGVLILFLAMIGVSTGAPAFPVPLVSHPAHYASVTGYQTTIYKPPIPSFQAPILQPTLVQPFPPPQSSFFIQNQPAITQIPQVVQFPQPVAQIPVAQQPQPQPQPQPLPQPGLVNPPPQQQQEPAAPVPQPIGNQQENVQPAPEVASDSLDTVEIDNPELRTSNAQTYNAPISAYPFYAAV